MVVTLFLTWIIFSSCALASMLVMFHFTLWISYAIPFFLGALVVETFFLSIFWILVGNNTFYGFNSSFPDCAKSHCYKYIHVTMPPSNLLFKIRIEIFALVFETPSACFLWSRSPTIRIKCHIWLWRLFPYFAYIETVIFYFSCCVSNCHRHFFSPIVIEQWILVHRARSLGRLWIR